MHKAALTACTLVVLTPLVLGAQQRDTTATDTARAFPLRPLVVTISKLPLLAQGNGFAVSVIRAADLAATRPVYAADALRNTGGAFIDEAVGSGGPTIVRLRGSEETFTQILVDGVQLNENGGFFDFLGFTLTGLDHIQIARGPQSAVWGSSAMAGVINFITRAGVPGPLRWVAELERGAATERGSNYLGRGSFSGGSERFRYAGGVGRTFARGMHEQPHNLRTLDGVLRLDLLPRQNLELTTIVRGIGMDSKLPVRDPGATRVPLDPNARNERDRVMALVQAQHALGERWRQQLRVSTYRQDFQYEDQFDDAASMGNFGVFFLDANFNFLADVRRTTGEYLLGYRAAGGRLGLSGGAQWERETLDVDLTGDFGDSHDAFDRESRAGLVELQLSPTSRLDLLLSTRLEKYDGLDAEHTPRASLAFALVPERLRLRAAAARGFKAPNIQTQYTNNPFIESNPDLNAETSTSFELGTDVTLLDGKLGLSVTAFQQEFRNLIRTVRPEGATRDINRNLGASDARGIEWDATFALHSAWRLLSSGAVVRTEIEDNQGLPAEQYPLGDVLPFRPRYNASFGVEWQPMQRFSALLRASTIGEQFVLTERFAGQRVEHPAYALFGLNLNYTHSRNTGLYLRVENLFDRRYRTAFDQLGQPLTATLGVRVGN